MRRALVHHDQHRVGADRGGLVPQRIPDRPRRRIDHHDHVLALLDRQALFDHGPDGRGEVAHRRRIISGSYAADRPRRSSGYTRGRAGVAQSVRAAES